MKGKKKKGFTLIELIIVVAIIGILAAIAVPKFGNVQKDAKIQADVTSAKMIADAAVLAYTNDEVPTAIVGLTEVSTLAYVTKYIQNMPEPKAKYVLAKDAEAKFYLTIDNGTVIVYVGDGTNEVQMYPTPYAGTTYPIPLS